MKLKTLVIGGSGLFLMVFSLLLFVAILFSDEQDSGISNIHYGGVNVSAEVLAHNRSCHDNRMCLLLLQKLLRLF